MSAKRLAFGGVVVTLVACRSHHEILHETHDASAPASSSADDQPETIVEVDTTRLAAYALTLADVEQAIIRQHVHVKARAPSSFVVEVHGPTPETLLDSVIAVRNGGLVRISDVARISIARPPH